MRVCLVPLQYSFSQTIHLLQGFDLSTAIFFLSDKLPNIHNYRTITQEWIFGSVIQCFGVWVIYPDILLPGLSFYGQSAANLNIQIFRPLSEMTSDIFISTTVDVIFSSTVRDELGIMTICRTLSVKT